MASDRVMRNRINLEFQTEDDVKIRVTLRADDFVLQMNSDRTLLTIDEVNLIMEWFEDALQSGRENCIRV